jgi:hypothetical protein
MQPPPAAAGAAEAERTFAALGPDLWNRTYYPAGADTNPVNKPWYTVDAEGQTLGRLATLVANTIRHALSTAAHIHCRPCQPTAWQLLAL